MSNITPGHSRDKANLYLDFEIQVGPGRGRDYPVVVVRSPAGEAQETMHFPFDRIELDNRLKDLQIALLRSGGARRLALSSEEQAVQGFGQALFDALLTGEVRSRYDVSRSKAAQQDAGLRIRLRIQPPELAALPWEYLYDPRLAKYICLSRNTPLVRYLELSQPIQPLAVTPPLSILGMVASPRDLPRLNVEREKQRVERAIQDLQAQGRVTLTWLAGQTWRDLQEVMWQGPWHIFHFIGHGGFDKAADEGYIALADQEGETERLGATKLGGLLADHNPLRLALLNSCEGARGGAQDVFSSTAAILVRQGLPAVLAMQYGITDGAAIEFSRSFYKALSAGLPVDTAVAEARKAISLSAPNTVEWGTPVLYMRAPDGVLFNLPKPAPEATRPPGVRQTPRDDAPAVSPRQTAWRSRLAALFARLSTFRGPGGVRAWGWVAGVGLAVLALIVIVFLLTRDGDGGANTRATQMAALSTHTPPAAATSRPTDASTPMPTLTPTATETATAPPPTDTLTPTASPSATPTPTPTPTLGAVAPRTRAADGMVMVYVPGGTFQMGSTDEEVDDALQLCNQYYGDCQRSWFEDEQPAHLVTLDSFWIDRTEVTNAQYRQCVDDGDCPEPGCWDDSNYNAPDRPVVCVSWNDAVAYCEWAGGRLPTEAEWEYAARGPNGNIFPWGDTFDGARLNFCDANCTADWKATDYDDGYPYTAPVGSYENGASWVGALDMAGNVWEWTSSLYQAYPYRVDDGREDLSSSDSRVLRGGSWGSVANDVRSASRLNYTPVYRNGNIGFRCVGAPGP
jgi:formylglycine-generating enzyme required for sulfatase activity